MGSLHFMKDASVRAFFAAFAAVIGAFMARFALGASTGLKGGATWKEELAAIFLSNVGVSFVKYGQELFVDGRKFHPLDMAYFMLVNTILGMFGTLVFFKSLPPEFLGIKGSDALTAIPLKIPFSNIVVSPVVKAFSTEHITEYVTEFNALWRAAITSG